MMVFARAQIILQKGEIKVLYKDAVVAGGSKLQSFDSTPTLHHSMRPIVCCVVSD